MDLVSRQSHDEVWVALPLQLPHPVLGAVERVGGGDVVYNNGRRRAPIAALGSAKAAATATGSVAYSFSEQRLHREQTNPSGRPNRTS